MFDFYAEMKKNETCFTENGALTPKYSGNSLVDLNSKIPNLRKIAEESNKSEEELISAMWAEVRDVFLDDKKYFYKWLLFLRDIRGGCGERDVFRLISKALIIKDPESFAKVSKELGKYTEYTFAEYGRWDDIIRLMRFAHETRNYIVENALKENFIETFYVDVKNASSNSKNGKISLLGKWLPKENVKSEERKKDYKYLTQDVLNFKTISAKTRYRKICTMLRKYLQVVEQKTSSNNWKDINYEAVPSGANLKYKNAFLKHDEERRRKFLEDAINGKKKIHSGTLYLYDIVHKYSNGYCGYSSDIKEDPTIEALWKNIKPGKDFEDTIVVRDGSGSMITTLPKSSATILDVATSLSIFCSEHTKTKEYKNKFITFSSNPEFVDLSHCTSLKEKLEECNKHSDCSNTDIEKVFDLILKIAVNNNLSNEELPKNILIISDMQFDAAHNTHQYYSYFYHSTRDNEENDETLFHRIASKYKKFNYNLPKLIFWNVGMYGDATMPVVKNPNGVILMSGFSQNLVDMAMGDEKDPWEALKNKLDSERYSYIDNIEF